MEPEQFPEDEFVEEEWDLTEEDFEPLERPWWVRPTLILVAAITALSLAAVPLYNVFAQPRPVAANGLEVCGFDYCIVEEAVRDAGLGSEMSRLSNTLLTDEDAKRLADSLTDYLGVDRVGLTVVDRLEGDLEGQYDPAARLITIERPARAWIVAHEVAHVVAGGHDEDFQRVLIDLAIWLDTG